MAIVLEANYSKKLGLPGYSSHQYGVTIRAELNDISKVPEESQRIYQLLQESVDAEIQHTGWLPAQDGSEPSRNGHSRASHDEAWQCSLKQQRLILKIVEEHKLDKDEIDQLARERFGKGVKALNRMEASGLIDELLEQYGSKQNSNGRRGAYSRNGSYASGRAR